MSDLEHYRETCFVAWYAAGKPKKTASIIAVIPADEVGAKPTVSTIKKWMQEDWILRAEDLDARSMSIIENKLVEQRKEILLRQATEGKKLQEKGMAYLNSADMKFASAGEALRAVIEGARLESKASGLDLIMSIFGKNDKELQQYIKEELTKSKGDDINSDFVDAEEVDATDTNEGND